MTMKLKTDKSDDCLWAMDMMTNLARHTYITGNYFEPMHYVYWATVIRFAVTAPIPL